MPDNCGMVTAQVPEPDKPVLTSYLDVFARSAATLLLVMYGVGFVILSAYEARYGIAQFGALRARIFLVGFGFTALSALPVAAHHFELAYFGLLQPVQENRDPVLQSDRNAVLAFGFIFTSFLMAAMFDTYVFGPATSNEPRPSWHSLLKLLAFIVVSLMFYFANKWIAASFTVHPQKCVLLSGLVSLTVGGTLFWAWSKEVAGLTLWFWVAAMCGLAVRNSKRSGWVVYALDFRTWLAIIVSVSIYVTMVMGHIQQKFGGGAPVPAVMYLNRPLPLANGATTVEVSLLDENEQGYYVLPPGKHKALFIPRGEVSSIYFGPTEDLPKSP